MIVNLNNTYIVKLIIFFLGMFDRNFTRNVW